MTDSSKNEPTLGSKTVLWRGLVYVGWSVGAVLFDRDDEPILRAELRLLSARKKAAMQDLQALMDRRTDRPDSHDDHRALVRFEIAHYARRIRRFAGDGAGAVEAADE